MNIFAHFFHHCSRDNPIAWVGCFWFCLAIWGLVMYKLNKVEEDKENQ
jgi:hypothetical protein